MRLESTNNLMEEYVDIHNKYSKLEYGNKEKAELMCKMEELEQALTLSFLGECGYKFITDADGYRKIIKDGQ